MHSNQHPDKRLKILNASAGSGKTYTLVKEFVKLLLIDDRDVKRFSQIIAMTFTNMASLEMKTRVIEALDKLSYPDLHGASADSYASEIASEIGCDPKLVNKRAAIILRGLLHSYEDFSVMTIDKFNLRLIRSFSRDLDLPADFEVVLNETVVIEQVVDLLMNNMGTEERADFTKAALKYAQANLDNEEGWDFRRSLIAFTASFSNEKQQVYLNRLMEEDLSAEKLNAIKFELKKIDDQFSTEKKKVVELHQNYGELSSSYPNGSHTVNFIRKLENAASFIGDRAPVNTLKACHNDTPKGKFMPDELKLALVQLDAFQETNDSKYATYSSFTNNYYNMLLLRFVANAIDQLKKDEKIIRISEFNQLISSLVQQENAPFIYERLGMRYRNFLLDEFQDTSHLQWLNMVPLMEETLSKGDFNLIVGDPKQSIYRFKNGVAEQFVELPGIFNPQNDPIVARKSAYFRQMGYTEILDSNWRSGQAIVSFNNRFFQELATALPEFAKSFYGSIEQIPKSKKAGYVSIRSKKLENKEEIDTENEVVETIQACLKDGFDPSDICILTDRNAEANHWALHLKQQGFKVVSAESLLVDNDKRVNLTISYLKRRYKPAQRSEMKRFAEIYFRTESDDHFKLFNTYLGTKEDKEGKTYTFFDNSRFIADRFQSEDRFYFSYETLYDLIQQFYRLMGWSELNNPYLHHLADFAFEFELTKGPDLAGFLSHYDEKRGSLAIQTPPSDDAIVVMTIHKSKGLEFPIVIIPSMDLDISIRGTNKFLLESDGLILHTSLSANSKIDAVRELQKEELDHIFTDKMNLCYVGLTRPKERLYVFNYWKKGLGSYFHDALAKVGTEEDPTEQVHFQSGETSRKTETNSPRTQFFEATNIAEHLWFPDIALSERNTSTEKEELNEERRFGNQFHLLMAELKSTDSLNTKIAELMKEGLIESAFHDRMLEMGEKLLTHEVIRSLYENADEVLNEQLILLDESNSRRPDKIIMKANETILLDYKTGLPSKKDVTQMKQYISIFKNMDMPSPKGFLYYSAMNELQEISN
jgi:ATP-dependent exoDNAse (exonuclease V) beta subunit